MGLGLGIRDWPWSFYCNVRGSACGTRLCIESLKKRWLTVKKKHFIKWNQFKWVKNNHHDYYTNTKLNMKFCGKSIRLCLILVNKADKNLLDCWCCHSSRPHIKTENFEFYKGNENILEHEYGSCKHCCWSTWTRSKMSNKKRERIRKLEKTETT